MSTVTLVDVAGIKDVETSVASATILTTMETLSTVTLVFAAIFLVTANATNVLTITTLSTVTHACAALILVTTSVAGVITITTIMVFAIPAVVPTTIVEISVTSVTTIMMAGELGQARKSELEAVTALTVPQEEEEELSILMLETILY